MLLFPTALRASSGRQSPEGPGTGRVPRDFLHEDWRILSSPSPRSLGGWEVGYASDCAAKETPLTRSSICWYFVNSWLLHTHPPTGFPEKKSQNILAEQANGSQMTEVKKKKNPRSSVICFLKAKTNRTVPGSAFSLFSLSCLSCETFCCLHFHSS